MPSVLTSSFVGASPTMLLTAAGQRTETTVSSPIAHVTRLAATDGARSRARHPRLALGVVRIAERAAERAARAVHGVLGKVRLGEDDRAGVPQPRHERRVVRRPIVGVLRVARPTWCACPSVSYWSLMAMTTPWSGPTSRPVRANARSCAAAVSSASGMVGGAVRAVGHAARLARVESPSLARRGPEVQRRQRVDLPGVGDGRDRAEDALRLVHAGAVIGLDALQVLLDDADRGDRLVWMARWMSAMVASWILNGVGRPLRIDTTRSRARYRRPCEWLASHGETIPPRLENLLRERRYYKVTI